MRRWSVTPVSRGHIVMFVLALVAFAVGGHTVAIAGLGVAGVVALMVVARASLGSGAVRATS